MSIKPIETEYAGCRFRSRLEARWAVFFDVAGIPWRYEPEGFELSCGRYLPDFQLPECDTWIEVKGDPQRLDVEQLVTAAAELPQVGPLPGCEPGPILMLLGNMPAPLEVGDWGWVGISREGVASRYGFGTYGKNRRPWWHPADVGTTPRGWLTPTVDDCEWNDAQPAYETARRSRFEYGETPRVLHTEEDARGVVRDEIVAIVREVHPR